MLTRGREDRARANKAWCSIFNTLAKLEHRAGWVRQQLARSHMDLRELLESLDKFPGLQPTDSGPSAYWKCGC